MQVLSVPPFLFFYRTDPARSLELCQKINNAFAETVQKYPDRFVALANLPMQDPEMAALRAGTLGSRTWPARRRNLQQHQRQESG
jgi:Amidohydrolase